MSTDGEPPSCAPETTTTTPVRVVSDYIRSEALARQASDGCGILMVGVADKPQYVKMKDILPERFRDSVQTLHAAEGHANAFVGLVDKNVNSVHVLRVPHENSAPP